MEKEIDTLKTKNQRGCGLCLWYCASLFTEYIIRKKRSSIAEICPLEAFNKTFAKGFREIDIINKVITIYSGCDLVLKEDTTYYKDKVISLISQDIPVVVILNIYSKNVILDKDGMLLEGCRRKTIFARHCCLINGYDTQGKIYRVQNSYGDDWGCKGHFYISEEYLISSIYKIFYLD